MDLAKAYVQIIPSAEGLQNSISNVLDGEATNAGEKAGGKLSLGLKAGLVAGGAAVAAAATKLVKASIGEGSALQQNLGGTEAVFGKFAKTIQKDATKAYKNMGMGASDYMATANKMGSLFQGSGLTQQRSLELTSQAMQRAADVASVMGLDTSAAMEAITGAAKGNFTMMDNLGVAMNATTLEAYALEKGVNFEWKTASNAEKAELAMQMFFDRTEQYAGNFADEAERTFSGSFDSMAAAAKNVLGNLALGNDIKKPLADLATATNTFVVGNLIPMLGNILKGVGQTFATGFGAAVNAITSINWLQAGADIITKIGSGISSLATDIPTKAREIANTAKEWFAGIDWSAVGQDAIGLIKAGINLFFSDIPNLLMSIGSSAMELFKAVPWGTLGTEAIKFIVAAISLLVNDVPEKLRGIANTAVEWFKGVDWTAAGSSVITFIQNGIAIIKDNLPAILQTIGSNAIKWFTDIDWRGAGSTIITFIQNGIATIKDNIPAILQTIANTAVEWFKSIDWVGAGTAIITFITNGFRSVVNNIPAALQTIGSTAITWFKSLLWGLAGSNIISKITSGIATVVNSIPTKLKSIAETAKNWFTGISWSSAGGDIIDGIISGITNAAQSLYNKIASVASSALSTLKGFFKIGSPSKVTRDEVGRWLVAGIGEGWDYYMPAILRDMLAKSRSMINQLSAATEESVHNAIPAVSAYTTVTQNGYMVEAIADAVVNGTQRVADGVERGIGNIKMVANNREYGRFISDLGFKRA